MKIKQFLLGLFPYDKLAHFTFVGVLLTLFLSNFLAWWITLSIVFIVAVSIEVYDKKSGKGNAEILDIVYALIGAIIMIALK